MPAYEKVIDFLNTDWRKIEEILIDPHQFPTKIGEIATKVTALRHSVENPKEVTNQRDLYATLAARQIEVFIRLCYRDGFAPILSSIVFSIEREIYDILLGSAVEKVGAEQTKRVRDELLEMVSFFALDYNWTVYLHTLVTIQRIKRALNKYAAAIRGASKWAKQMDRFITAGLNNIAAVLPLQIPIQWLIECNVPVRLSTEEVIEIHKLVKNLWVTLSGIAKVGFLPPAPVPEAEVLRFYSDFAEGTLRIIQEQLTSKYHLPPIGKPLRIVVVYGEEAKYTQSVAFFRETAGGQMEIVIFKPPQAPFNPAQDIHLLFHEGIPGHAYAAYLHLSQGGVIPVDEAMRITNLSGISFVDAFSVFHEGWAVFAQKVGAELSESFDLNRYFFVELLSYLERFMVLENLVPLYTVKPHIPRFAEPFQFSSYFVGFLLWEILSQEQGMGNVWRTLSAGNYPIIPSGNLLINALKKLLEEAVAIKEQMRRETKD